ncbi:TonB-dependent receptor domain-containing protein [Kordia sp.]|uniref:TonB-dependent receptor domain-containing protein n=1 Tax=Kordia sp. TaxID=1965332 RepID=UPI003D6A2877
MKKIIILFVYLAFTIANAQQNAEYTVKGKVVDKTTQQVLEYATVTILDAKTNKVLEGGITNRKGNFSLDIAAGTYNIKVEFISFKSYESKNVTITKDLNLGTINLEEDLEALGEVEIIAEKSTVELKLDKKVFNVGKDLLSQGGTVNDILDNVPSVSVDAGGGISLRGSGNVRILINGKPSALVANNGLDQIPAETISKVEVITNPSARYEAQGTAGIINIILKKNKKGGLNGSVQLGVGDPREYRANLNLSYKADKVNFFTNVGYRNSNFFGEETTRQTTTNNGITNGLTQNNDQDRNDEAKNIFFGGDYYINNKNTLTASFYHTFLKNTDETRLNYSFLDATGNIDSTISRIENYKEPQNFNRLEMNYVKTFEKKGQKLEMDVQYDFWNDDEQERIRQQRTLPATTNFTTIRSDDVESSKDFLFQANFVSPLTKTSRLETGFRSEIRRITSDYMVHIDDQLVADSDNELDYNERIYGVYAQYGNKVGKFSYLLGLRVEHSDIGIDDEKRLFNDDKDYTNLFPTAHFSYEIADRTDVQLSYSRRINRPAFWQLNPFGGLTDFRNLRAGNPDLNPMYTNSFEAVFLKRWSKFSINPSIYYQHTTDFFNFVTNQTADGNFVTFPVNLDTEDRIGFELSMTYNPFKWWRISSEFNFFQYDQKGDFNGQNFDTKDEAWFTRINSRMRFKKGLSMQTSFNYRGRNQNGQTLQKAQYFADFGISKDIFGDKGAVSLSVRNIFDSRIRDVVVTGENFRLESERKAIGRRVSLTFVYRFNRKKGQRDRLPD